MTLKQDIIADMQRLEGWRKLYKRGIPSGKIGSAMIRHDVLFLLDRVDKMQEAILMASQWNDCSTDEYAKHHVNAALSDFLP